MESTFVVLSDTHFTLPGTRSSGTWWNRTLFPRIPEISRDMVSVINSLAPDFVIHCGDFTASGDIASFQYGKEIMERLCCPYYMVMGNHDARQPGIRKSVSRLFGHPDEASCYEQTIDGTRFIFLDSSFAIKKNGHEDACLDWDCYNAGGYSGFGPARAQLEWLRGLLQSDKEIPTVVVNHLPLISKPAYPAGTAHQGKPAPGNPTPYSQMGGFSVYSRELRSMINSASNVKLVLSGHWHIFDITFEAGTCYCQTGSLLEFPFEMRLIRMQENSLSFNTVGLSDPAFRKESFVRPWQNQFVAGEMEDRERSFSLN